VCYLTSVSAPGGLKPLPLLPLALPWPHPPPFDERSVPSFNPFEFLVAFVGWPFLTQASNEMLTNTGFYFSGMVVVMFVVFAF
jgi:hypothetical protein